jgi:RNA polymerase sigma-70 factor (ECF subfamily)
VSPPDLPDLDALIARLAAGDRDALRALIEGVGPYLHATILRTVSDRIAAGVLLEESFAEIWAHAPLYDAYAGDPWTWMMTVARSRAVDRRQKRKVRGKAEPVPVESMTPAGDSALDRLDPADAQILLRVFHDGLPGGASGAADRERFAGALRRLADEQER